MKHAWLDRSKRWPFHVRVVTDPRVPRCWSVNLSVTGIGLVGSPRANDGPHEGDEIAVEIPLPYDPMPVKARGVVRWRHDQLAPNEAATAALGIIFTGFEDDGRVRIARYLEHAVVWVAVVGADAVTQAACVAAVGDSVQLDFATDSESVLQRADVSAIVVCGDEVAALEFTQRAHRLSEENLALEGRPRDLAARIVYAAPTEASHVARLFDEKKIHRWVPPPCSVEALRSAIVDACATHASRLETERMAQELERNLQRERALRTKPEAPPIEQGPGFRSPEMQRVLEQVRSVAPYKVSVLLQGETGTGKEVLSRVIHRLSDRRNAPIVVQDCGTLTETLLESELFGHVRGAFTGAVADHPGLFVLSDGGTVFLDEIENTTAALQAKLLRVLETGEVRAVGSTHTRRVDVRVITASNRPLAEAVKAGHFRADLYYRLNTFTIEVPPLRARRADIVTLARSFVEVFNHQHRKNVMGLSVATERALVANAWPGNVRELRNVIERAVLLCQSGTLIEPSHLPAWLFDETAPQSGVGLRATLSDTEKEVMKRALERHGGIVRRAALELGVDPVTFARRAKKHGLVRATGRR